MAYSISRFIFKVLLKIFCRFRVIGARNIPVKGPFILASNHVSYIDPAVVGATCDKVPLTFIAKQELFRHPRFGWWFKAVGCIPAERESGSARPLKIAIKKLKTGKVSLAIFPEGTRSADGSLQKAEPGIGFIAVKAKAPIIPIYVSGTDKVLPKGAKKARPYKVIARIGKTVDISESRKFSDKRKAYECIGEKVMDAIARLKNG